MTERPNDRLFRLAGVSGLVLLLGLVTWQDRRGERVVKATPERSPIHDHTDPGQHDNTLKVEPLDHDSGAATLSGRKEGVIRVASYEAFRFGFSPDPLVVTAGERVRLRVKSRDVEHGMMIPEIDFSSTMPVGDAKDVEFIAPASPGEYPVFCNVFCGTGHGSMKGTLVVLPKRVEDGHGHDRHE